MNPKIVKLLMKDINPECGKYISFEEFLHFVVYNWVWIDL